MLYVPRLLSCSVQWQQTQEPVGDVAPNSSSGGSVCYRQHFQLPAPHFIVYSQLSPGAAADISWENAFGHPEVSLHLLFGNPQIILSDQEKSLAAVLISPCIFPGPTGFC